MIESGVIIIYPSVFGFILNLGQLIWLHNPKSLRFTINLIYAKADALNFTKTDTIFTSFFIKTNAIFTSFFLSSYSIVFLLKLKNS